MKKAIMALLVMITLTTSVCAFGPNGYDKSKFRAVYRVFNPMTGEHLYAGTFGEASNLQYRYGWRIEKVEWYSQVGAEDVF